KKTHERKKTTFMSLIFSSNTGQIARMSILLHLRMLITPSDVLFIPRRKTKDKAQHLQNG
ncbi:hypothetical protein, partial [uncultured Dubosiella sp.]|uniref:hypothetical protein n=1 Tax=uncultured Dubosiella sp. TaxID=1937011 RepID=UPI0026311AA3